jgi:hypothetical protein
VGIFIMPLLALMLVICSFFAKISRGIIWAVIVFAATVVQHWSASSHTRSRVWAGCTASGR